jgi:hypothetical protein
METISMATPDKKQASAYSWLHISIILFALITAAYLLYSFYNPISEQNNKTDYFDNLPENIAEVPAPITKISVPTETVQKADDFFTQKTQQEKEATDSTEVPFILRESTEIIDDNYLDATKASDQSIYSSLTEFSQQTTDVLFLLHNDILRSTVVFVENFRQGHFISTFSPMNPPKKPFMVRRKDGKIILDPLGYQRYDEYADYIYSFDSKAFVQYYRSLKPSIDEFYAEIAPKGANFDDALNEAIEVVLSTPILYQDIVLTSPSVMYVHEDKELENMNNAQKLLIRMGPQNLAKIKHKLRSIQAELAIVNN